VMSCTLASMHPTLSSAVSFVSAPDVCGLKEGNYIFPSSVYTCKSHEN